MISHTDFEFLRRLSSLYEALTHSAVDPICVTDIASLFTPGKNLEMKMYYDAFGRGDREDILYAEEIMQKRIDVAREDIEKHDRYHKTFLELCYSIDETLNKGHRKQVAHYSRELCKQVKEYVISIVKPHRKRLQENAFLDYPSCNKDYSFHIPGIRIIGALAFNTQGTFKNARADLIEIYRLSKNFSHSQKKILLDKIATQFDSGEGLLDTSLRGRFELNQELLRRIGFVI